MAAPPPGPKAGSRGTPPPVPKAATPTPVPKAAAAETSAAGLRFGGGPPVMENYDSMRKIGRGNYGTVYLARDTRNGKHYCLKQIQMETYSAEERANAQQEVEVLRTLDHPGIVRYREHFLHGDSLCVVMTYCEGGDLAATIKRRAKKEDNFTEAEVLDWFVQLVMALHHVHSKKILHRDLKTQNIFITKNLVKVRRHAAMEWGEAVPRLRARAVCVRIICRLPSTLHALLPLSALPARGECSARALRRSWATSGSPR